MKCTFCKIHGHGTYIYVSYVDLESSGANLSLDIVYSALERYLKSNHDDPDFAGPLGDKCALNRLARYG